MKTSRVRVDVSWGRSTDTALLRRVVARGLGVDLEELVERRLCPACGAADHGRLNALLGLAEALECRRRMLLGYFGEAAEPCGHCDLCDAPPEVFDATTAVRKALSAMLRTEEWFGAGHLIDILTGAMTDKIRARGHDKLPTFGVGTEYDKRQWQAVFRQMMGHDLVRPDPERHGALRMTEAARPILRGEAEITLRKDVLSKSATRRPAARGPRPARPPIPPRPHVVLW